MPYELHGSANGKFYMTMPKLVSTLEHISLLSASDTRDLWDNMRSALEYLHALGFAHMDVKPSNICVDASERCVLVDLGSLERFGNWMVLMCVYVFCDMDLGFSTAAIDWWMLAMTLAEVGCGASAMRHGLGAAPPPSKSDLMSHLRAHLQPRQVLEELEHMLGV